MKQLFRITLVLIVGLNVVPAARPVQSKAVVLDIKATMAASDTLTPDEQQLLDRALSPTATKDEKERAKKLCKKCKPCFDGNSCDLKCIKAHCAK